MRRRTRAFPGPCRVPFHTGQDAFSTYEDGWRFLVATLNEVAQFLMPERHVHLLRDFPRLTEGKGYVNSRRSGSPVVRFPYGVLSGHMSFIETCGSHDFAGSREPRKNDVGAE